MRGKGGKGTSCYLSLTLSGVTEDERITDKKGSIRMKERTKESLEKKLEEMKANPCEITPEAMESLLEPAREANAALNVAMDAYERDLDARRTALDKQAADLDGKIKTLKADIEALEDQSREAASRGDLDAAAELDEKAEALRKQLSTASRKRRIATSTELQGDAALFNAIKEAKNACEEAVATGREYVMEARAVVKKWAEFFEQLQKQTETAGRYGHKMDYRRFEKIDQHFNAKLYAKLREKAEAEEREREAAWEAEKARRRSMGNFYAP